MKTCRSLWGAGIAVDLETCRKWLPFEVEVPVPESIRSLDTWKVVLVFNQLLHATNESEIVSRALERFQNAPFDLVVKLRKYYPETKDIEPILELPPEKEPEYAATSKGIVDFFLNYLKFEEGVDVEGLVEPLRKMFEREQGVEEFLRLCGIDELIGTEEFLSRVEKAVDVLAKAKEQGLDVEEILKKWDELANGGGSRFVYLEEAVKAVADEEVGRRFWEEVEKVLGEEGVRVSGTGSPQTAYKLFYLELTDINGVSISLEPGKELFTKLAAFLRKVRPVTLYTVEEVEKVLDLVGIGSTTSREDVLRAAEVLASLDRFASSVVFEENIPIHDLVRDTEEGPETLVKKLNQSIKDGFSEGLRGESLIEYVRKRVQS